MWTVLLLGGGWALLAVAAPVAALLWLRHRHHDRKRDRVRDAALRAAIQTATRTVVRRHGGDDLMALADTLHRRDVSTRGGIRA